MHLWVWVTNAGNARPEKNFGLAPTRVRHLPPSACAAIWQRENLVRMENRPLHYTYINASGSPGFMLPFMNTSGRAVLFM